MLRPSPSTVSPMSEATRILSAIEAGDPHAAQQLLPLVYDELRRLAAARLRREAPGQTLDATALVHEAFLRLVGAADDRIAEVIRASVQAKWEGHEINTARFVKPERTMHAIGG